MKARSMLFGLVLLPLLCAVPVQVPAQTAQPAAATPASQAAKPAATAKAKAGASSHAQSSEAAARKQLATDLAAFQNTPEDDALRDKIVALAKTFKVAPPVPKLALDNYAKATAQLNAATTQDDFKTAASTFAVAAIEAPWYAEADFAAANASAKADDSDGVKRNLALYRAAVRPGVSTQAADDLEAKLDRQKSTAQFQAALQQYHTTPTDAARLDIIKAAMAMNPPLDIPEEARGHYVMAVVLMNTAEDNAGYLSAIDQFKLATQTAPWWGDAYKKLAAAQKAAGKYDDAIASLNLYLMTSPADARSTQDEVYSLTVLAQRAAFDLSKKQAADEQRKQLEDQKQKERESGAEKRHTLEGKWYETPTPGDLFVGGKANPECDYAINQNGGRWVITNTCAHAPWAIDKIAVRDREISFRLTGHDPGYPTSVAIVTFWLSADGEALNGQESIFNTGEEHLSDHAVRWVRRE